jgi:hypothetical protein
VLQHIEKAKQYLWAFVEIGFLTILSVILIYLILGDTSGVFVTAVAANVLKFAGALPAQSLVGLAIVLALVILLSNRTARQTNASERVAGTVPVVRPAEEPRPDDALSPAVPIPNSPPQAGEVSEPVQT